MRINANPSMAAFFAMRKNYAQLDKSVERLSSGLRINSAADDAAGLAMSERMTAQIRGQRQAGENVKAGIDMFRTADGALSEIQDALQRMRELSVYAANGTLSDDDRSYIQSEIDELTQFIDDTIDNSRFNKIKLFKEQAMDYFTASVIPVFFDNEEEIAEVTSLVSNLLDQDLAVKDIYTSINDAILKQIAKRPRSYMMADEGEGGFGGSVAGNRIVLQAGANEGDRIAFELGNISVKILGIANLDLTTQESAARSITRVDEAIDKVSAHRALVGAEISRMEHIVENLTGSTINLEAAQSRITDADIAKEMLAFVKLNLLAQSAGNVIRLSEETRKRVAEMVTG